MSWTLFLRDPARLRHNDTSSERARGRTSLSQMLGRLSSAGIFADTECTQKEDNMRRDETWLLPSMNGAIHGFMLLTLRPCPSEKRAWPNTRACCLLVGRCTVSTGAMDNSK